MYHLSLSVDKDYDASWYEGGPLTYRNCMISVPGQPTRMLTKAHAKAVIKEIEGLRSQALSEACWDHVDRARKLRDQATRLLILKLGGVYAEVVIQPGLYPVGEHIWVRDDLKTRGYVCEGRLQFACRSVAEVNAALKHQLRLEIPSDVMVRLISEKVSHDHLSEGV